MALPYASIMIGHFSQRHSDLSQGHGASLQSFGVHSLTNLDQRVSTNQWLKGSQVEQSKCAIGLVSVGSLFLDVDAQLQLHPK